VGGKSDNAARAETYTLCFSIDGEWLTQHVRNLWAEEDRPDHALRTLMDGLQGITLAQAIEILEGKAKLVGDSRENSIEMVPDDATTTVHGQPLPKLSAVLARLMKERDKARDGEADLIQLLIGDVEYVASPTGKRKIPQRKAGSGGSLVHHPIIKEPYDYDTLPYWQQCPPPFDARSGSPAQGPKGASAAELPAEPVEKEDDPPSFPLPPAENAVTSDTGWLSPEGKFYRCRYHEHIALAGALGSTEDGLAADGWLKFCTSMLLDNAQFVFCGDKAPTQIQRDLTYDYCVAHACKLPDWLGGLPSDDMI